jgi:hypothetical protein
MLDEMSIHDFDEWVAYHELEAWGDHHRQNANLMATVLNSQGGKKGGKPFTAEDFLPRIVRVRDEMTEQQLHLQHWKAYVSARSRPGQASQPG